MGEFTSKLERIETGTALCLGCMYVIDLTSASNDRITSKVIKRTSH